MLVGVAGVMVLDIRFLLGRFLVPILRLLGGRLQGFRTATRAISVWSSGSSGFYLSPSFLFRPPYILVCSSSSPPHLSSVLLPCSRLCHSLRLFTPFQFSVGFTGLMPNGVGVSAVVFGWTAWSPVVIAAGCFTVLA